MIRTILLLVGLMGAAASATAAPTAAIPLTPSVRQVSGADDPLCRAMPAHAAPAIFGLARRGNRFAIVARHPGSAPHLLGTLIGQFSAAGALWCSLFEIGDLDHAIIDVIVGTGMRDNGFAQYRGPAVPPAVPGPFRAGRIESRTLAGTGSGLTRRLSLYLPRAQAARLVVLLDVDNGDNSLFHRIDAMIARGVLPPMVLVGIPMAPDPDFRRANDLRLQEMHAGMDSDRYRAFERFVFVDLLPGLRAEFPHAAAPAQTAFVGESASASWVVDHAADHEGDALAWGAFSLAGIDHVHLPTAASGPIFMGVGTFELDFLGDGLKVCGAIRRGGGDCRFATVASGHGQGTWDELIAAMLIDWAGPQTRR